MNGGTFFSAYKKNEAQKNYNNMTFERWAEVMRVNIAIFCD